MNTIDVMQGTRLKLLGQIMDGHRDRKIKSLKELASMNGLSINGVLTQLKRLKRDGLITWDYKAAKTMRPTCCYVSMDPQQESYQ